VTTLHYVKAARKGRRKYGIKRGHPYYWWRFARCEKQYSLVKPPRSAYMTRSPFLRALMDMEDSLDISVWGGAEEVITQLESAKDVLDELLDELQEKLESLQSAFPNGCPSIELLESRVEAVEEIRNAVDSAQSKLSEDSTREEVEAALDEINWEYE
jgi:hypothetical protein